MFEVTLSDLVGRVPTGSAIRTSALCDTGSDLLTRFTRDLRIRDPFNNFPHALGPTHPLHDSELSQKLAAPDGGRTRTPTMPAALMQAADKPLRCPVTGCKACKNLNGLEHHKAVCLFVLIFYL